MTRDRDGSEIEDVEQPLDVDDALHAARCRDGWLADDPPTPCPTCKPHVAESRPLHFDDPADALAAVTQAYRLDRTRGQDVSVYLGVEKAGMVVQLQAWFERLGVPILALGGYSSQTYVDQVAADATGSGRPAVLLYAGDFDPSGEDIDRDFIARVAIWHTVHRVALSAEQVREHQLPVNPGKATDSRAAGFIQRHGALMQVELDALPPETLRQLYTSAIAGYWDTSTYEAVIEEERAGHVRLLGLAAHLDDMGGAP